MSVVALTMLTFILISTILFLLFYTPLSVKEPVFGCGVTETRTSVRIDPDLRGSKIFKQNCAFCHSMSAHVIIGPGLNGIMNRVPNEDWLKNYILNNEKMVNMKDAYALKLRREFPDTRMTVFEGTLDEKELSDLIWYLQEAQNPIP